MFRQQLMDDLKAVWGFEEVRFCPRDDETNVLYFNIRSVVSEPQVGSGKTHFRVYGSIELNMDEANGQFGYIMHKKLIATCDAVKRFQQQSDETGLLSSLYDQHRILTTQDFCWESDIDWNEAPDIQGIHVVGTTVPDNIEFMDEHIPPIVEEDIEDPEVPIEDPDLTEGE